MNRTAAVFILFSLVGAMDSVAQESAPRLAPVEITMIPGGATHFTKASDTGEPAFTNYDSGVAIAANINRVFAVEGDVTGSFGFSQTLSHATFTQQQTTPNLLHYSGSVVVSVPLSGPVVPFVTGGVGGLSIFDRDSLVQRNDSFFTSSVGGGVKWRTGRWGLRADYRFLVVRSHEVEAAPNERPRPDFFGKETRFGHRVFGGIVLNVG